MNWLTAQKIRMKAVTSGINRAIDVFDSDGNPLYLVKSSNVIALSVPENLRKGALENRRGGPLI